MQGMKPPITLSPEFSGILDQMEYSQDNIFITGRAGTGKSTLLQIFRNTSKRKLSSWPLQALQH